MPAAASGPELGEVNITADAGGCGDLGTFSNTTRYYGEGSTVLAEYEGVTYFSLSPTSPPMSELDEQWWLQLDMISLELWLEITASPDSLLKLTLEWLSSATGSCLLVALMFKSRS